MSQSISFLQELEKIICSRKTESASESYTARLINGGIDKTLQKVGEEAVEYIIDAKNLDKARAVSEAADLLYHLLVSFQFNNISLEDIDNELKNRHK